MGLHFFHTDWIESLYHERHGHKGWILFTVSVYKQDVWTFHCYIYSLIQNDKKDHWNFFSHVILQVQGLEHHLQALRWNLNVQKDQSKWVNPTE